MQIVRSVFAVGMAVALAGTAHAAQLRPDQATFFDLYRELVETDTTFSAGDCTKAATQVADRMRAAKFAESELTSFTPPDRPREGGLVVVWQGSDTKAPALLLLAHLDVVEAKREDWESDPFKLVEIDGYFRARGARSSWR